MSPNFSISVGYVLWLWRYELISALAIAFGLTFAVEWTSRRYLPLAVSAEDHELPNVQLAPDRSISKLNRGVPNL